jgi:hypothetical protein
LFDRSRRVIRTIGFGGIRLKTGIGPMMSGRENVLGSGGVRGLTDWIISSWAARTGRRGVLMIEIRGGVLGVTVLLRNARRLVNDSGGVR